MGNLRDETIAKLSNVDRKRETTIDDVGKQAQDMDVIDKAMNRAKRLAGADVLTEQLASKDEKISNLQKEKDKATQELHESEIRNVKTELGSKIDDLQKAIESGASRKSIGEQIIDIKKAASELGLGGSKVSEIKDIMSLIESFSPKKNLAEQVKEARELLVTLQPSDDRGKGLLVEGVPAQIAIELKQMDHNLQIKLAKMEDDRQQRNQEFQLTLKRYDEERLTKQAEIEGRLQVERERNDIIAQGLQIVGGAAGKAYADALRGSAQGVPVQAPQAADKIYEIELGEGESGTTDCPKCHSAIGVGPTTTLAQCVNCGSKFPVVRTGQQTQPAANEVAHQAEQEE
jgi:molecular chaperone GrpE (heat shock protein)